jgi:hypothetical protein
VGRSHRRRSTSSALVPADQARTKALLAERNQLQDTVDLLQESIAELQLAMEDVGWTRMLAQAETEFTRDGLTRITAACRLFTIKNPLVRRGFTLRSAYIWGQGVEIAARATGKNRENDAEQDVNQVVQDFLDDPGNRQVLFDAAAQQRAERALFTDGNLFIACWTKPTTGRVQVRTLPWDEIQDVITNPDDASEPWFYKRVWQENTVNYSTGVPETGVRTAYYPALGYRPRGKDRPKTIGGHKVHWDAPVRHIKVNDQQGWRWGIGDAYAALDWARAYKEFLEAWATLVKALSRFAWRLTAKGSQRGQARARLAAAPGRDPQTGQAQDVGATAIIPPEMALEAIPKSGAVIDAESGKPLASMVASALDVPLTMLLADPGQTGARAVAETLDQPTELVMKQRQQVWAEALRDILTYVIAEAVRAPRGPLKGTVARDPVTGQETITLAGDTPMTVDIAFPDPDDIDPATLVKAIVDAASTGTVPPELILRWLLTALGERNIDEILDRLTGENGEFLWPNAPPLAGSAAADAQRAGEDPAAVGPGPMGGLEGEPADEPLPADGQRQFDADWRQSDLDWGLFGGGRPAGAANDGGASADAEGPPAGEEEPDEEEDIDLARFRVS